MQDIIESLNKALIKQGWLYGEKFHRIGNPYVWVDTEQIGTYKQMDMLTGGRAFLQYLALFFEDYPIPKVITTQDYDEVRKYLEQYLIKAYQYYVPFIDAKKMGFDSNIKCTAIVRAQDYSAIRSFCSDLKEGLNHLDIGPGLGTHALYSLNNLKSNYYALEAYPHSYYVQREFFKFLSFELGQYLDIIECENLNLSYAQISEQVNKNPANKIKHIPSWYFDSVADKSIDLVTATWVLNEVNTAGILWLVSNILRTLRKGGKLYIRDSSKLKPLRHSINYDELFEKVGFAKVGTIDVRNRIDFYGVPRVYQKDKDLAYSFDELVDMCVNKQTIAAWGGIEQRN